MRIIRPVPITDAILTASSLPESEHAHWNAGVTYGLGALRYHAGTHRVYESLQASNTGHDPRSSPAWWVDKGPSNLWAMFDRSAGTQTLATNFFRVELKPGAIDSLALVDTDADSALVEMIVGGLTVYSEEKFTTAGGEPILSWSDYVDAPLGRRSSLFFGDLPMVDGATVRVTVFARTAANLLPAMSSWSQNTVTIDLNADVAPDGTVTAIRVKDDAAVSGSLGVVTGPVPAGSYAYSAYVRKTVESPTTIGLQIRNSLAVTDTSVTQTIIVNTNSGGYNAGVGNVLSGPLVLDRGTYWRVVQLIDAPTETQMVAVLYPARGPVSGGGVGSIDPTAVGSAVFWGAMLNRGGIPMEVGQDGALRVGTLIVGKQMSFGTVEAGAEVGITDFSRKETNEFGGIDVVERAFANRATVRMMLPAGSVDDVMAQLASIRATPAFFLASDRWDALGLYGFYKDFNIDLTTSTISYCSMTIESLA